MFFRLTLLILLFAASTLVRAQDSPIKSGNLDEPNRSGKPESQDPKKDPGPQRDPGADREAREIFFRTLSETRSRGAQEFSYLLFQESVRKEINLGEEDARAAREVLSKTRSSAETLYEQLKTKEITSEQLKVKMLEVMTNADRDIWKILVESNSKHDRLVGLFVQHRHCSAVLNKIVAEKVGLEESRRQEILGKKEKVERDGFEDRPRDAQTPGDRMRAWEKIQKKIDGLVSEMLTVEQREKLEKLKGEPFKFEEFPFLPGPPGRGREGGRDRNRRDNGRDEIEKCRECDKLAGDR